MLKCTRAPLLVVDRHLLQLSKRAIVAVVVAIVVEVDIFAVATVAAVALGIAVAQRLLVMHCVPREVLHGDCLGCGRVWHLQDLVRDQPKDVQHELVVGVGPTLAVSQDATHRRGGCGGNRQAALEDVVCAVQLGELLEHVRLIVAQTGGVDGGALRSRGAGGGRRRAQRVARAAVAAAAAAFLLLVVRGVLLTAALGSAACRRLLSGEDLIADSLSHDVLDKRQQVGLGKQVAAAHSPRRQAILGVRAWQLDRQALQCGDG